MDLMIDIETLGTADNAVVMSIGAVCFDDTKVYKDPEELFLENITASSNDEHYRSFQGSTIDWWLRNKVEALKSLIQPEPISLDEAIFCFKNYIASKNINNFWANGVSFDFMILDSVFEECEEETPWSFRDLMCMRSIREMGGKIGLDWGSFKEEHNSNIHSSVDDAICQAEYVVEFNKRIRK